jgi:hypothetical protein
MRKLLVFILCIVSVSCRNKNDAGNITKEWIGKSIEFPSIQPMNIIKKYAKTVTDSMPEYKILLYIDSTDCTSCKFQIEMWRSYIKESGDKIKFLFYFHLKDDDEFLHLLEDYRFNYPVYIDTADELNRLNRFPANPMFQCFLLDKNNQVLAFGNPVSKSHIWEYYKNIVYQNK